MQVTVITPIAPHHEQLFPRCRASVEKQTVPVRHLHMVDKEQRGPGYIRNKLLEQVKTPYVVFLDADDYLEPMFVEECLTVIEPEKYVFTDWYQGSKVCTQQPGRFWETALHLITCLIHTDMMRIVNGFDEEFPAMEDTDLFLKFDTFDYCGIKYPKPLVHYTNEGRRGVSAHKNNEIRGLKLELMRRYKVGCCGNENNNINRSPVGKKQNGDVLVLALWEGNRVTGGAITGRRYQRASKPMRIWIDPRDAKARPDLYRIIPPKKAKPPPPPTKEAIERPRKSRGGGNVFGDMLIQAGMAELPPEAPLPVKPSTLSPNFNKVNEIAQRIYS
jgi:glycosyltransferase involved in cell wall biosynthesis